MTSPRFLLEMPLEATADVPFNNVMASSIYKYQPFSPILDLGDQDLNVRMSLSKLPLILGSVLLLLHTITAFVKYIMP